MTEREKKKKREREWKHIRYCVYLMNMYIKCFCRVRNIHKHFIYYFYKQFIKPLNKQDTS